MDYYLDEQLPKQIAHALDALESHEKVNRVFSTEERFGKGIKDTDLFQKLKTSDGILITHDLKIITRRNEITLLKGLGLSAFIISLPSGANFELQYQTLIGNWAEIKKIQNKNRGAPFICRIKMRGTPEFL